MRWTILRSCYSFPMRLFIDGQAQTVPARWFFCNPNAQHFPTPHGCEASPWLLNNEINHDWGEVSPWPTDRTQNFWRGLDRGLNPGYAGQCYVGALEWFVNGRLPADILTEPVEPFPNCCASTAPVLAGGIVIGGTARASGSAAPSARSRGGLTLGGSAVPLGRGPGALTRGGNVLGGRGFPGGGFRSSGGLVLGGTATPTKADGSDCQHAIPITLGAPAVTGPFTTPAKWYRINLVAGTLYHAYATSTTSPTQPLYWNLDSGPCDDLNVIADTGYSCGVFTAPYTGVYYLEVLPFVNAPGTWSWYCQPGPC